MTRRSNPQPGFPWGADTKSEFREVPGTGRVLAPRDAMLARLLQRVRLEDGGVPGRHATMTRAVARMLQAPTGRALAERFIVEDTPAVIRFEAFEGSRIYTANGRKIFHAPRALTGWQEDHIDVRLNLDYLGTDDEFQEQDLPPTLAHELLGHGLWSARAARESALLAILHHELNEENARLVGWRVDFELDGRFEEIGAWAYLADPSGFLRYLKLRHVLYALTWSTAELGRPRETLEERSQAAQAKRDALRTRLANHLSWNAVIDHFVLLHGVVETRMCGLRNYMADAADSYHGEIAVLDTLIAEVDAAVERMIAEPDGCSERYLRQVATYPLIADLQREVDHNARRLREQVRGTLATPDLRNDGSVQMDEDSGPDQITFAQLLEMYRQDREEHPEHWRTAPKSSNNT